MTEIQWLVDIMLNHKLPSPVKDRFIARIGEVEASLQKQVPKPLQSITMQAASTQKLLDEMMQDGVPPVAQLAQTAATAQALANRQAAIATAGKTEPGRTSPRKF